MNLDAKFLVAHNLSQLPGHRAFRYGRHAWRRGWCNTEDAPRALDLLRHVHGGDPVPSDRLELIVKHTGKRRPGGRFPTQESLSLLRDGVSHYGDGDAGRRIALARVTAHQPFVIRRTIWVDDRLPLQTSGRLVALDTLTT